VAPHPAIPVRNQLREQPSAAGETEVTGEDAALRRWRRGAYESRLAPAVVMADTAADASPPALAPAATPRRRRGWEQGRRETRAGQLERRSGPVAAGGDGRRWWELATDMDGLEGEGGVGLVAIGKEALEGTVGCWFNRRVYGGRNDERAPRSARLPVPV
jgi:hypothetical protein